uniref:Uncharacterized protein n=1 Tax=Sinocyclocheilus anshuiensis TaxID=1608454 RepID=A0A671L1H0_9TELE
NLIAQLGGVALVVKLLTSDLQDVLVNAVRCIRTLYVKSPCNQTAVAHAGGVPHLVEFLSVNSEVLQEEACLALAELAWGHRENQRLICEAGAVGALVQALHNPAIQQCFLRQSTAKYLCFQLEVREQGATALWALAGQTLKQQKLMAEQMGYLVILDLLLSSSDKMQYVGKARYKLVSLYTVPKEITQFHPTNQSPLNVSNTLLPFILLQILNKSPPPPCLCIGVALNTNKKTQKFICREKAIPTLLDLLKSHESLEVKVQVAQTLACVLLGNQKLQREFWEQEDFSYDIILELMGAENKSICLDAGHALSLFVYNNKVQHKAIRQTGRILMNTYETFLSSDNETESAKAAFQVFRRFRTHTLGSKSLRRISKIKSPHIYDLLMENLAEEDARISQLFTAEFERQRRIGFPSLSLEINGGPPVPHRDNKGLAKRMNARCSQSAIGDRETPALLPHHARQRARTANPRVRTGQTSCHNAPKQRLN